jgi:hypothetical protein
MIFTPQYRKGCHRQREHGTVDGAGQRDGDAKRVKIELSGIDLSRRHTAKLA